MPCELMEELEFGTALNYVSLRHHSGGYSFSINYNILRVITHNFQKFINLESWDHNGLSSSMLDSNIQLEGDGQNVIHNLLLPRLKNENIIARYRRLTAVRQQRYSRGSKAEKQLCEKYEFINLFLNLLLFQTIYLSLPYYITNYQVIFSMPF